MLSYGPMMSRQGPPAFPHAMPDPTGQLVAVRRLPSAAGMGSVPRGFFETEDDCSQTVAAFIRGTLYDKAAYWAMPLSQRTALERPPRWVLYAGPFTMRQDAINFHSSVWLWANRNGYIWLDLGSPCIVPRHRLAWPPDASWQWTWVNEQEPPRRVVRVWNPSAEEYRYQWA
jgi:hypothetical protein